MDESSNAGNSNDYNRLHRPKHLERSTSDGMQGNEAMSGHGDLEALAEKIVDQYNVLAPLLEKLAIIPSSKTPKSSSRRRRRNNVSRDGNIESPSDEMCIGKQSEISEDRNEIPSNLISVRRKNMSKSMPLVKQTSRNGNSHNSRNNQTSQDDNHVRRKSSGSVENCSAVLSSSRCDTEQRKDGVSRIAATFDPLTVGQNLEAKDGDKRNSSVDGRCQGSETCEEDTSELSHDKSVKPKPFKKSTFIKKTVPSRVTGKAWLRVSYEDHTNSEMKQNHDMGGYWLIFLDKKIRDADGFTQQDRAWLKICDLVKKGKLSYASCSTAMENPSAVREEDGVINVFTPSFANIEEVERTAKLISSAITLKRTMFYKTKAAIASGKYKNEGKANIALYKYAFDRLYVKTQDGQWRKYNECVELRKKNSEGQESKTPKE